MTGRDRREQGRRHNVVVVVCIVFVITFIVIVVAAVVGVGEVVNVCAALPEGTVSWDHEWLGRRREKGRVGSSSDSKVMMGA